eukprot:1883574-Pleurochrysis_carterae.AAC.1
MGRSRMQAMGRSRMQARDAGSATWEEREGEGGRAEGKGEEKNRKRVVRVRLRHSECGQLWAQKTKDEQVSPLGEQAVAGALSGKNGIKRERELQKD